LYDHCCSDQTESEREVKLFCLRAWEWLRSVPAWLWAVLGWLTAAFMLRAVFAWKKRAQIAAEQARINGRFAFRLAEIETSRRARTMEFERAHEEKKEEIEERRAEIDSASTDLDTLSDEVNKTFGDPE